MNNELRDDLISYIWDAYKDAYGVKPRHLRFSEIPTEELKEMADDLSVAVTNAIAEEEAMAKEALVAYNKLIDDTIEMGAGDRETAIRWLVGGDIDNIYNADEWLWKNDLLSLDYETKKPLIEEINVVLGL